MGRVRLAIVGCIVATVALTGCGTDKSPNEALGWTCADFGDASSSQHAAAIKILAAEVSKKTGNPPGDGKKVLAQIKRLCAGAPSSSVVGNQAVEAVVAGSEDPAGKPADTTTVPAETTTAPADTTTAPADTTTAPAETTTETTTAGPTSCPPGYELVHSPDGSTHCSFNPRPGSE